MTLERAWERELEDIHCELPKTAFPRWSVGTRMGGYLLRLAIKLLVYLIGATTSVMDEAGKVALKPLALRA